MRKTNVLLKVCVILVLCIAFIGCGCGEDTEEKYRKADKNTLFIASDLTVVCTIIDSLDKEYYDAEELRTFIDSEIQKYNYSILTEAVSLIDLSVNETAGVRLILKYGSAGHYTAFNQEMLFIGTIAEAMEAGYDFDTPFYKYDSLDEVALADAVYNVSDYVVIMEPTTDMVINVPEKIKFIGADVEKIDKATAQVKENCRSYIIYE